MKSADAHFNDECSDGNDYEKSIGGLLATHLQARTTRPSLIWLYPLDLLGTFRTGFGLHRARAQVQACASGGLLLAVYRVHISLKDLASTCKNNSLVGSSPARPTFVDPAPALRPPVT